MSGNFDYRIMQLLIAAAIAATSFLTQCYIKQLLCVCVRVSKCVRLPKQMHIERAHTNTHTSLAIGESMLPARSSAYLLYAPASFIVCFECPLAAEDAELSGCSVAELQLQTWLCLGWGGEGWQHCFVFPFGECATNRTRHTKHSLKQQTCTNTCVWGWGGIFYFLFFFLNALTAA